MDPLGYAITFGLAAAGLFTTFYGIPILIRAAEAKRLMDHPGNDRKIHQKEVPALGGIAIAGVLWLAFSLHPEALNLKGFGMLLSSSIIIFTVALKDDLFVVDPYKKLFSQITAACLVIFGGGVYIQSFGGVFGIDSLPFIGSVAITLFVFIVVINALNLIDGIDGLAGSLVCISSLFFGFWFYSAGLYAEAVFSLILAASMGGFLIHNWQPASIFMGDTGALLSGFYLSFLGIRYLNASLATPDVFSWQPAAPIILVAALVVPLYDTLRVFILRAFTRKSPFDADANHIHHQMLQMGMTHSRVTLTLAFFQILILGMAIVLSAYLSVTLLLGAVLLSALLLLPTVAIKRRLINSTPARNVGIVSEVLNNQKNGVTDPDEAGNRVHMKPEELPSEEPLREKSEKV
ncbi:MAG: undecaprenyl/decaprenyl-phosphate alpha-N-acetylglucosaminyl 1-phosphate transferase [Bacteroidetes bacterium]|jgi:UDP-N-acetylmuramyl pentapeptide phosphotransferase/UDP-N-acetylglucosamine-1-phosphate transferase|nr:undecaprenyl/decaprenyl-phosphate alpha-N-acetylglucosaminyl 1-phosphate transferase [Bacteroidota bacterium]